MHHLGTSFHRRPSNAARARNLSREQSLHLDPEAPWVEDNRASAFADAVRPPVGTCYFNNDIIAQGVTQAECTQMGGDSWQQGEGPNNGASLAGVSYYPRDVSEIRERDLTRDESLAVDPQARWVEAGRADGYTLAAAAAAEQPVGRCYFQGDIIAENVTQAECTLMGGDRWKQK